MIIIVIMSSINVRTYIIHNIMYAVAVRRYRLAAIRKVLNLKSV